MPLLQWLSPSPMWEQLASATDKTGYRRPTLLRFATDTFMEDLEALLARDPSEVRNLVAAVENWREPKAGLVAGGDVPGLKLYQPVHARFYLVSASLVCRLPGLPDHSVHPERDEAVAFVLRRKADGLEYAYIPGPPAQWIPAGENAPLEGEERLPMFPYSFESEPITRRLFAGLVPVSRQQQYATARKANGAGGGTAPPAEDPRKVELGRVLAPWVELRNWSATDKTLVSRPDDKRRAIAQSTAFILIDTGHYLESYTNPVWRAIKGEISASTLQPSELALYNTLAPQDSNLKIRLREAMRLAVSFETQLEAHSTPVGQPPSFPPGYPLASGATYFLATDTAFDSLFTESKLPGEDMAISQFRRLIEAALPPNPPPFASRLPDRAPSPTPQSDEFIIRCVYERPHCGGRAIPVLSAPSRAFRLASFFDPDAPARPLRVALPLDTTPAGLRKFDKNVAFTISDELQKQLSRVKDAKSLLDGDVQDPQLGVAFICSLSIPIITIVAFLLLMVFVVVLNIIFWWLPFFKICFPVPTLKGKE